VTRSIDPVADQPDEARVREALRAVVDPDLRKDIVSLGFVKDVRIEDGRVAATIELTTPACPVRDELRGQAERAIRALPGVTAADVRMTAVVPSAPSVTSLIPGVRNVVAIASGKGGVGKSTLSANIAAALALAGARVGLMDADVYGPSIPAMMGARETPADLGDRLQPVVRHGVKIISMGFFLKEGQAVVWRGPMLHKMVQEFLGDVDWHELDYLLVDLPPGTGDIQLSLCQTIPLTGALVVSTPQDVAVDVARKAIAMFDKLNVPVLGLVENMSAYVCPHCGEHDDIFGAGGARRAAERLQLPYLGAVPLASAVRERSDEGTPIVIADPTAPAALAFTRVAELLAAQVSVRRLALAGTAPIAVTF